jgi:phage tail-like protein
MDPLAQFHYKLELEGKVTGLFLECSGLGSEHEVIEHKVVQDGKDFIMKVPGRLKWDNIVLKRGITDLKDMWDWRKQVEDGDVEGARMNGTIYMMGQDETSPVAQWNFERGWPLKVSGPQLKSDANEIGVEELTICHEHLWREQ